MIMNVRFGLNTDSRLRARGYLVPDVIQPNQYMQGVKLEYLGEVRVYILSDMYKGEGGHYSAPRLIWKR